MNFTPQKRKPIREVPYHNEEYVLAKGFADEVAKELGDFVKSIVLFGSSVRKQPLDAIHSHDIDVLIIVNDLTLILNDEVTQSYRVIVHNLASKHAKRLHITTMTLTNFWGYVRMGDPIVITMLRDGIVLQDMGIFEPVQQLLYQGKIRPSKEAVWTYYSKAPMTLKNSQWHVLQAVIDLYWAVTDASHAVLMYHNEVPTSPEKVSSLMRETVVKKGILPAKYADEMQFFYELGKKIMHREIAWVSGKDYDAYLDRAQKYIKGVEAVIGNRK